MVQDIPGFTFPTELMLIGLGSTLDYLILMSPASSTSRNPGGEEKSIRRSLVQPSLCTFRIALGKTIISRDMVLVEITATRKKKKLNQAKWMSTLPHYSRGIVAIPQECGMDSVSNINDGLLLGDMNGAYFGRKAQQRTWCGIRALAGNQCG